MRGLAQTDKELLYGDPGYTGEVVSASELSRFADPDYYRQKVLEFQSQLNALAASADTLLALRDQVTDSGLVESIDAWLADFYDRKGTLLLVAEGVNAAAQTANAAGVRMPVVSVPQQLAAFPPLVLAAIAGAAAGVAWAIAYAVDKIAQAVSLTTQKETIALLPENERAAALAASQKIQQAQANAQSALGSIAGLVKWIAIGLALFFGYRAIREVF